MSASWMGMARSWVDWRRRNWLDVMEPQHSQKNQMNRQCEFEFGWNVFLLLDVLRGLNLTKTRGDEAVKREIGVLKFYKP